MDVYQTFERVKKYICIAANEIIRGNGLYFIVST